MPIDDGDGHRKTIEEMAQDKALDKVFKGATVSLGELIRQDGIITEGIDKMRSHGLGVTQTLITAESDDENYRQILIRARWKNQEHRNKFIRALAVCRVTGARMAAKTLLDQITADSAGDDGAIRQEAKEMLTHTTWTTHEQMDRKKKYDNSRHSSSPIA